MRKFAAAWLVVLVASVVAAPASAGPVNVTVRTDRSVLAAGRTFTLTAHANVSCQWLLQWNGTRRVVRGKRAVAVFTAPAVGSRTTLPARATCFSGVAAPGSGAGAPAGSAERIRVAVALHPTGTAPVTVRPPGAVSPPSAPTPGTQGTSGLPDTGGPSPWLLLAGLAALGGGTALVRAARDRSGRDRSGRPARR